MSEGVIVNYCPNLMYARVFCLIGISYYHLKEKTDHKPISALVHLHCNLYLGDKRTLQRFLQCDSSAFCGAI